MRTLKPFLLLVVAVAGSTAVRAQEAGDWAERISLSGDFRLRQEGINEEGEDNRTRWRYRARLAVTGEVSDSVSVVMELASGASDPVSRNVTLDGGFDVDDIGFDLAYVRWKFADGWTLSGGKMRNPLFRAGGAPLIWDGDLNPDGLAISYSQGALFATAGTFSVEERSSSSDSFLNAIQVGGKFELSDNLDLTAGAGYFGYSDTIGNEPFFDGEPQGNSVDVDGNYLYEYRNVEAFAELRTRIGDWPLTVFGHWTQNNEADIEDTAYAFGARAGSASDKGDWRISWTYQDIEADSVIGTFNDSDFGGGGTDASGHIFNVSYVLSPNIVLAGTYFTNEVDRFQGVAHDYDRYQLDVQFSFD